MSRRLMSLDQQTPQYVRVATYIFSKQKLRPVADFSIAKEIPYS
jgi:hypothetical protein